MSSRRRSVSSTVHVDVMLSKTVLRPFGRRLRFLSTYASEAQYLEALRTRSELPAGFKVGTHKFTFKPREMPHKTAPMTLTLIALEEPTTSWAAMFTSNAFPGAPVIVGRKRFRAGTPLQAIVVNNKISNVCAPGGVEDSESMCIAAADALKLKSPDYVLPSSTGIIGWKLPVPDLRGALPEAATKLQAGSILPAAVGICTTDLYPKVRSVTLPGGARIVGIAKGAGMVEPNLATMLVYILTDAQVDRATLDAALRASVHTSFNALSIDSDQSTSDTVVAVSSMAKPLPPGALPAFHAGLAQVCTELSEDIVRNGEGVQHVMKVQVVNAGSEALARSVGKAIVNSPLFKCAVAGNDPNVGRLVCAIGNCVGKHTQANGASIDVSKTVLTMGGRTIFSGGVFQLPPEAEAELVSHLKGAQLWATEPTVAPGAAGTAAAPAAGGGTAFPAHAVSFPTPVTYPPHERTVDIRVDLGLGPGNAVILGADLTHEYVACNADYRS